MELHEGGNKRSKGRPRGIPREGRYGTGVKTKTVRVPLEVADNIQGILEAFEGIKVLCDTWEDEAALAGQKSRTGEIPARYYHAVKMLKELRGLLGDEKDPENDPKNI